MAKIKQGILGGFSGKVANVVGTSWKGRAVMKSQPLSVANPRTTGQVEQRTKFSKIAELASVILTTFVQPVENPISGDVSGYNKFVKDNKAAFNPDGTINRSGFMCGGGRLQNIVPTSWYGSASGQKVTIDWTNDASVSPLRLTDKIYAAAFTPNGAFIGVSSGTTTRNAETLEFAVAEGGAELVASATFELLIACVSADGRDVSVMTTALLGTVSA